MNEEAIKNQLDLEFPKLPDLNKTARVTIPFYYTEQERKKIIKKKKLEK